MKATIAVSALLLLVGAVASAAAEPQDIGGYCRSVSRGSYQSEAWCIDDENKAYREVAARGAIEQRVLDYCTRVSRNWTSMKYCIEAEEQARAKLQQR